MKELENLTDSQKIDYLIKKVNQIERIVNPPLWETLLKWFIANFWTLLFLVLIGYFLWQVWELVQAVQAQVFAVQSQIDNFKLSVLNQFKGFGEALGSLKEFDMSRLKFWEST